jgi:LuxR family transcriptional regulator, maltose regulon positive regulatory protein
MPFPVLPTKLYPPLSTAGLVDRQRLIERVKVGVNSRVTILAAPPGFGKTTLLSAWLATDKTINVAWVTLDEDDNEPGRFFTYIAAALRPIEPVPSFDSLCEASVSIPRELTVALLHDLSEFSSKNVVLVLDDYHHITQQPIHDALAYLIDQLPNNIHIVFTSRADPPLPLGRWRVRGQLTEIRADDLRFTEAESAQFLNETMGLALSAKDICTLATRTEGWVAGLQLAALSLQKSASPGEIIAAFAGSNRYVADYLTDEVLSRQPATLREFLLETSIFERFNASLCNYVLQRDDSEAIITELERANLFIIPLDSDANWFRYHHLFADLLKRRISTATLELHQRAAEWFEQHNFLLDAVRHWIVADEPDRVAALVEDAIGRTWGQAELAGHMQRIESLPETTLAKYPTLSAFLGWTWLWLGYGSERILPLLDRAEKQLEAQSDAALGRFNVIRSFIVRIRDNNVADSIQLGHLALSQLSAADALWRGFANMSLAISLHSSGNLLEGESAYKETIRLCEQGGDTITALVASCAMTQLFFDRGDLPRALSLSQQMANTLRARTSTSLVRGWVHINTARAHYLTNDIQNAWLETNLTLDLETQTGGLPDVGLRLYVLLAKLELLSGNESAARKAADDLVVLANRGGATNAIDWAQAVRAELLFRLKDWPTFDSYARVYQAPQQPLFFPYRLQTLLRVRYLARQKAWGEGRHLVQEQVRLAREAGYREYELELHIVHALLEQAAGDLSAAKLQHA